MFYGFYGEDLKKKIQETMAKFLEHKSVPSENELDRQYRLFQERFGVYVLSGLQGENLIETMFNGANRDSLVYWLEFKSDESFKSQVYGSIAGGSAAKFLLWKRKEDQKWYSGQNQEELSIAKAVQKGTEIRDAILRGAERIEKIDPHNEQAYADLQEELDQNKACPVGQYVWIHKYYHMLFPNIINSVHAGFLLTHLLLCLGHKPKAQETKSLYTLTGQFMSLIQGLGPRPTVHTEKALLDPDLYGEAIKYYRIGTTAGLDGKSVWEVMREKGHVSIGWREMGDLKKYVAEDDQQTKANLQKAFIPHFDHPPVAAGKKINEIFRFFREIKINDLVAACEGETLLGIGRVLGPYEFIPDLGFPHTRQVKWLYLGPTKLVDSKEGVPSTVRRYKNFDNILNIRKLAGMPRIITPPGPLPPLPETLRRIEEILERKSQAILYGPPGTGKTYYAEKAAYELAARKAFQKSYERLSVQERLTVRGDGKTRGLVRMCCFHPSYGYEDFVEGIKPKIINDQVVFEPKEGIFKRICRDARANKDRDFFLIIDEINRGEISRIFGELITLIENTKREETTVFLPVSGDDFLVPRNVYLIGTMNTADRSIALLDLALRRRFGFLEFKPEYELLNGVLIGTLPLAAWLSRLNDKIAQNMGREGQNLLIGHSYFMAEGYAITSPALLKKILAEDLIPLLEEYCYGDYQKLAAILGDKLVDPAAQTIRKNLFDQDFQELAKALLAPYPELQKLEPQEDLTEVEANALEDEPDGGEPA